jgi:hypothetical protein
MEYFVLYIGFLYICDVMWFVMRYEVNVVTLYGIPNNYINESAALQFSEFLLSHGIKNLWTIRFTIPINLERPFSPNCPHVSATMLPGPFL